jgi:hypothetical protein
MKTVLIGLFFIPLFAIAQKKTTNSGTKKTPVAKTASSFKKTLANDSTYYLSDIVNVKNGKDEYVKVQFSSSVPKNIWDRLVVENNSNDKEYFSLVAGMLALEAQFSLKNQLSFEPFNKQFFIYYKNAFACTFKMMGRNGYGNLVETESLVDYQPKRALSNTTDN